MGGDREVEEDTIENAHTVASDLTSTADTLAAPAVGSQVEIESSETLPAPESMMTAGADGDDIAELFDVPADHYAVGDELARGGMGRIFNARDRRAGREVAVKEVRSELLERYDPGQRKLVLRRFEREARITARLQHPGIVPVYEIGRFGDNPFFAMKMVSGQPLDKVIKATKTLSERLALLPTVLGVAEAIAYAHEKRVIHRDLKPANVLVGSFGETVVIDWGLAKDLTADDDEELPDAGPYRGGDELHTMAGTVLGTPHYMPPEQAAGEAVDARADVYALGAILYHLLSGKPPYNPSEGSRDPLEEILSAVLKAPPPLINAQVPNAPADLVSIVDRAMSRDPADRYQDADALAADLRRFQTGQLVATHEYSTMELVRRWVREHKGTVATAAGFLIVLLVASTVFVKQILDERQRTAEQRDRAQASARQAMSQKATAEQSRDRALALAEDRGREELLAGRPIRAAMFLSEAYRAGRRTEMLSLLLGQSMKSVDSLVGGLMVKEPLKFAKFSPDGKTVLIGGARGMVTVWRPGHGILFRKRLHKGPVVTGTISHDGKRFSTAGFDPDSNDYRIGLWRLEPTPEQIASLGYAAKLFAPPAQGAGNTVSFGSQHIRTEFSTDDKWLAVGALGSVNLWDARTGAKVRTLASGWGATALLQFVPSGSLCVATGTGRVTVWNPATGEELRRIELGASELAPVSVSANGKRVATASVKALVVHDLDSGAEVARIAPRESNDESKDKGKDKDKDKADSVRLSADGRYVTTVAKNRARVFRVDGGAMLHNVRRILDATVMRDSHRDRVVLMRKGQHPGISVNDLRSGVESHFIEVGMRGAWFTDISLDGRLAMGIQKDRIFVWSTEASAAKVYEVAEKRSQLEVLLSPKGSLLLTRGKSRAWLWRTGSAAKLAEIGVGGGYVFRPDDARLVVYGETATLWDTTKPEKLRELSPTKILKALFSPDNRHLVTIADGGQARLWDATTGRATHTLGGTAVEAARFGASSALILRHGDGSVSIVNPDSGGVVARIEGGSKVSRLAVSKTLLVTVHADGTGEGWSLKDGKRLFSLRAAKKLRNVTISDDERFLATRTRGDSVIIWDGRSGRQLRALPWAGDPQLVGDGTRVLIGANPDDEGDGPSLWDAETGKLIEDFGSHHSDGMSLLENVSVVPGGRWLIAGHERQLIDAASGRRLMGVGSESRGRWFPDGSRFYLVGSTDPSITAIVELPFPRERRTPEQIHAALSARSPWQVIDGRLLPKPRANAK